MSSGYDDYDDYDDYNDDYVPERDHDAEREQDIRDKQESGYFGSEFDD